MTHDLTSSRTSKQALAYATIRQRILRGAYGPGYRLVIDALAQEFQASPTPIREAVRRLEAEGLVEYVPNSGPRVAGLDPRSYVETMTVLALLEGYATALAGPHIPTASLQELREMNGAISAALQTGDPLAVSDLNRRFHFAIYAHCPNAYLVESIRQAWERLDSVRRTVFLYVPGRGLQSVAEHDALIDLIAAGAPAGVIQEAAHQHKLSAVRTFQEWQTRQDLGSTTTETGGCV